MQLDKSLNELLQSMPKFIKQNTSNKVILEKFNEMYYKKTAPSIELRYKCLNFLENIDSHTINFLDNKCYIGEDCIDNVIKKILRNEKIEELKNSNYVISYIQINPDISLKTIQERLDIVGNEYNLSYIVKHDSNFSKLKAEILVIGIQ